MNASGSIDCRWRAGMYLLGTVTDRGWYVER